MPEPGAPSVSVIVPAYNCGRYLGEALDSVLDQTLPPREVIVVDDGSTDDTPQRCAAYGDPVRYVRQENRGVSAARNAALDIVTGEYVALLDADDVCAPDRLARQAAALSANPGAVACYAGHWVFGGGNGVRSYPGDPSVADRGPAEFLSRLLVHTVTLMFRRGAAEGIRFPAGVTTGEDMIFATQLRHRGPAVVLPETLYGYRRHPEQATARFSEVDSVRQRLDWLRSAGAGAMAGLDRGGFEAGWWRGLAEVLAVHYWARRREQFLTLQDYLRANWPSRLPPHPVLTWRWYPDWLWNCKDRLGRLCRQFRPPASQRPESNELPLLPLINATARSAEVSDAGT